MQSICLHEDDRYRITLFRGTGDGSRLAVSFDHGRGRMQGFEPAEYPNFALRLGIDALRVQTACRSPSTGSRDRNSDRPHAPRRPV